MLSAISIPLLGESEAKKLLKLYTLDSINSLEYNNLIEIEGYSHIKTDKILNGLKENYQLIRNIIRKLKIKNTKGENVMNNEIQGKNFVFTGKMERKRDDLFELCESLGSNPQKSITKSTDYLVMGESVGKSKIDKAEKFGIMKISEDEFMEMVR